MRNFRLDQVSSRLVFFSLLSALLPYIPAFRVGLNALLSDERISDFEYDDENLWYYASEYHRGHLGLVDYLFLPINGNLFLGLRAVFLVLRTDDWAEARFLLGLVPGTLALAATTLLTVLLVRQLGVSNSTSLGIGLLYALSPHSRDLFSAHAIDGLGTMTMPLIVWLLYKQVKCEKISGPVIVALSLLPLLIDGKFLILSLSSLCVIAALTPTSKTLRLRFGLALGAVLVSTIFLYLLGLSFGLNGVSYSQPDYPEYPPVGLLDGVWIELQAHSLHLVWSVFGMEDFRYLGGTDPIPGYAPVLTLFLLVTITFLFIVLSLRAQLNRGKNFGSHFRTWIITPVMVSAFATAIAVGRGTSGWEWNAPRYSIWAPFCGVLLIGLCHRLSNSSSWKLLADFSVAGLVALQIVHALSVIRGEDLGEKLIDQAAAWGTLGLTFTVLFSILKEISQRIESELLPTA